MHTHFHIFRYGFSRGIGCDSLRCAGGRQKLCRQSWTWFKSSFRSRSRSMSSLSNGLCCSQNVCVCVRERERERESNGEKETVQEVKSGKGREIKNKIETDRLMKQLFISIRENKEQTSQKILLYISLRSVYPCILWVNLLYIKSAQYFLFTQSVS